MNTYHVRTNGPATQAPVRSCHFVRRHVGWGSVVGQLYDYCQRIQKHIEDNNLDMFKSRGAVALRCGFLISLVQPTDPDDPEKIEKLREAAQELFGIKLD